MNLSNFTEIGMFLIQHTARHERLDKLMGEDFKQYRANMSCGHDDCVYKNNLGKHDDCITHVDKSVSSSSVH